MNSSEEICLLTTFAQMAQARRTNVDEDFIKIIVLEIYEVRTLSCKRQLKNIFFWIIHPLILLGLLLKKNVTPVYFLHLWKELENQKNIILL